jgi:hypothetical protein
MAEEPAKEQSKPATWVVAVTTATALAQALAQLADALSAILRH